MKKILTILIFIPFLAQAQTDSVKVSFSEEKGTLEQSSFVDNSEYFLMRQVPIKQLFKFQIGNSALSESSDNRMEYNLTVGFERKLTKKLSIDAAFDFWNISEGYNRKKYSFILEPRYYFKQKVSNLSGLYVGAKFQQYITGEKNESFDNYLPDRNIGLKIGVQNRFLRMGLLDLGVNLGILRQNVYYPIWQKPNNDVYHRFTGNYTQSTNNSWFIRSEARVGLGLSDSKNKYKATTCDVFRCLEPEKSLLKIDFTNMFFLSKDHKDINIDFDYEFKIRQSAWSINQNFDINYFYINEKSVSHGFWGRSVSSIYANTWSGHYSFAPRYYYNLNKRIRHGKSANNLSGNYISLTNGLSVYEREKGYQTERIHTGVVWGMQRKLVKNGFFDFNTGIAKTLDGTWVDSFFPDNSGLFILLSFKVGYLL